MPIVYKASQPPLKAHFWGKKNQCDFISQYNLTKLETIFYFPTTNCMDKD